MLLVFGPDTGEIYPVIARHVGSGTVFYVSRAESLAEFPE